MCFMRKNLGATLFIFAFVAMWSVPVSAQTITVSQTITITARVAPTRSIVVNEQGVMTKIYSNTSDNVAPKVYLYDVPGKELPLTSALLQQYNEVIKQQKHVIGVEIPVNPPSAHNDSVQRLLFGSVSTILAKI